MDKKILFFGTPDFSVTILDSLVKAGYSVTGVFTQTDKPKGRGNKVTKPPVKEYAEERGIPVYQPKTLRDPEVIGTIKALEPDMIITAAYGKIFPPEVLEIPQYGCINVHGSLLPKYRGAAPVQRSIINGETQTGVTIMRMDEGCDTGDMISKRPIDITPDMNCEELFTEMGKAGAELLIEMLPGIFNGTAVYEKQDDTLATYSPKIEKSELTLDFSKTAKQLHDLIRGVYPYLACSCIQYGEKGKRCLKIAKTEICEGEGDPGSIIKADVKSGIVVACGEKALRIVELIPEGKQKMSGADYIRGRQISDGDLLKGE